MLDIFISIFFIIEATLGVGSIVLIVAVLFGTIAKKFYRKAKYGISLYD